MKGHFPETRFEISAEIAFNGLYLDTKDSINGVQFSHMFENVISYAYDFNIIVNEALVRELEDTACAFRCCGRCTTFCITNPASTHGGGVHHKHSSIKIR